MKDKTVIIPTDPSDEYIQRDRFWTPASLDYAGSNGNLETQYAKANYFSIGDVGDPDWRNARALPFGDENLEAIYPGNRSVSFILYPFEHPDADLVSVNRTKTFIEKDPALEWAIKEFNVLHEKSSRSESEDERMANLSSLISDIRSYQSRQIEEETSVLFVPDWAMDALIYSQMNSYDPESTRVIEEFAMPSSNSGTVISSVPYTDNATIESMFGVTEPYEIRLPDGSKEYCFALKNNSKTFGPYGNKLSALVLRRDRSPFAEKNTQAFRDAQFQKLLAECKISLIKDNDGNYSHIRHPSITSENLAEAKESYDLLAKTIFEGNSTAATIVSEITKITKDLASDEFTRQVKKAGYRVREVIDWCHREYPETSKSFILQEIPEEILVEAIPEYFDLKEKASSRVHNSLYILSYGHGDVLSYTSNREEANNWKNGSADHVLWYLLNKKNREEFMDDISAISSYGFGSKEYVQWKNSIISAILRQKISKTNPAGISYWAPQYKVEDICRITAEYLAFRTTKFIPSKAQASCAWLFSEIPFTRKQINLLNDCLEAYGRAIVEAQQKMPIVRTVYSRIRAKLELLAKRGLLPENAVSAIQENGNISLVYQVMMKPVPTGSSLFELKSNGLISRDEERLGKYLHVDLYFDYVFNKPSDVFKFIRSFVPSQETLDFLQ